MTISKDLLRDLKELRDELDSLIETLEIMNDEELMESLKKSETQSEKREFGEFFGGAGYSCVFYRQEEIKSP